MTTYAAPPWSTAPPAAPPYPQVPVLETVTAVGMLVINVFVPGLGTLISGIITGRPLIGRAIARSSSPSSSWAGSGAS